MLLPNKASVDALYWKTEKVVDVGIAWLIEKLHLGASLHSVTGTAPGHKHMRTML